MQEQRIAIIGGGAIGGVLAAAAAQAGHRVTICARTPFERLAVEAPDGTWRPPVSIVDEPASAPRADWILLATKVQDVPGAAPWLRALDDGRAPIALVQNGVEHRESVAEFGLAAPLLPVLIYVGAERLRPGHVVRRSDARLIVPEGELGSRFAELVAGPTTHPEQDPDFRTQAWRKMLTNVVANPVTALTMRRLDVFGDADVQELARGLLDEAIAVARAEGAALTDDDAEAATGMFTSGFSMRNGSSMLYDRLAGTSTEHEHITGPVVRAGERHGIATPLNRALLTLMRALPTNTGQPSDFGQPEAGGSSSAASGAD